MNKKLYVPLELNSGTITIDNQKAHLVLPARCRGLLFAFETKKAARDFMGRNCKLQEMEIIKKGK